MNYFKSILLTAFALFALASCDTDDLRDDVDNLKDRVSSLEAQVNLLNDNMTAIKRLLEGGQSITNVNEVSGTYTLTLSDGSTIKLTQGSEGTVKIPEITVNTDGQWEVEGVVLTQNGTPVQAVGTPGTDGITPKFQITKDGSFWQVSYDNGTTWEDVKNEKGEKVSAVSSGEGGSTDTFFESAKVEGDFFVIKLTSESEPISIPIVKDVICKIVEPTEGFKNGVWEIGYGKTATTEIEIKGENIIANGPAGWTVSVSDIDESTNKATLSVTAQANAATLTRATADNSCEVTVQANTNASWAVAKIQVKAIEIIDSYYELYKAGGTITIGGIEINKETFKDAVYISDNSPIEKEGIYFIKEGITTSYNGTGTITNLIIIGDNSQVKSSLNVNKQIKLIQPTASQGHFICKNINIVGTTELNNQIFTYNTDNNPFKYVIFDQCQIVPAPGKHLLYLSTNTRSIKNFYIENSIFKSEETNEKNVISLGGSTSQEYQNVVFKNNIFYCISGKVSKFSLFKGQNAGITKCTIENNTFINMETATTAMVYTSKLPTISIKNNIFWTNTTGANDCYILRIGNPSTGDICVNNIVYKSMSYTWQMCYGGKLPFAGAEELKSVTSNPFDGGTFDLDKGIFIPSAEYAQYGASIN